MLLATNMSTAGACRGYVDSCSISGPEAGFGQCLWVPAPLLGISQLTFPADLPGGPSTALLGVHHRIQHSRGAGGGFQAILNVTQLKVTHGYVSANLYCTNCRELYWTVTLWC